MSRKYKMANPEGMYFVSFAVVYWMDYMHDNPVASGFVSKPEDWKYSSAGDYAGIKGQVDICMI